MYESKNQMVSHPSHYQSETGLEVIDVIESFTFDLKGIEATDTGNILKYICRWKNKNGLEDLEKAKWYLDHLIDHVSKLEEENKPSKAYDTDYYVETRYEAEKIVSDIHSLIRTVGNASVSDLLTILGIRSNYCDTLYGWTNCVDINPIEENGKHIIRCLAPSKLNELNKEKEN